MSWPCVISAIALAIAIPLLVGIDEYVEPPPCESTMDPVDYSSCDGESIQIGSYSGLGWSPPAEAMQADLRRSVQMFPSDQPPHVDEPSGTSVTFAQMGFDVNEGDYQGLLDAFFLP